MAINKSFLIFFLNLLRSDAWLGHIKIVKIEIHKTNWGELTGAPGGVNVRALDAVTPGKFERRLEEISAAFGLSKEVQ
jgi:hypothetical protein